MRYCIILIAVLAVTSPAVAAEVVLREQVTVREPVVRLGDVADLSAADAGTVQELSAAPLMPAPAPGSRCYLRTAQIRDLLTASCFDVGALKFGGSDVVAIDSGPATREQGAAEPTPQSSRAEISAHLSAAIVRHLRDRTEHELWSVAISPTADVIEAYEHAEGQLTIGGGQTPYVGRQHFTLTGAGNSRPVRLFANVERFELLAFALRPIAAGDYVRAADVALKPHAGPTPRDAVRSLEAVVGQEAVQAIRADAALLARQVRPPLLVRRGERVSVRARAAGIIVRTYGTAQQDGSMGDLVQVQSLAGKERYAARVSGSRELEVFAATASANELAAPR